MGQSGFVGRREELGRLARVLFGDPGTPSVVVVTGDAGIGKSRLLAEALDAVPDILRMSGACLSLSHSLPYGAISDALSDLGTPSGRPTLDGALARCAPFVLPQLGGLIPALCDETVSSSAASADRLRLFAAVRDLLRALVADRRTALVVENLHWADAGTMDLLTFLIQGPPSGAVLLVSSRRGELAADHPVVDWLASTSRLPGVESIDIPPLARGDVGMLVSSLVDGEADAGLVADVIRRGEGNPLFTEQLVAASRDRPRRGIVAEVPAGVAHMLLPRIRALSYAASHVAALLAVASRPLAESELAAGAGVNADVASGLRDLLDARLVDAVGPDQYKLRHALLEEAVQSTLLPSQLARAHGDVARLLSTRAAESPVEVALHWAMAGDAAEEARWAVAAARHAEGLCAWPEASDLWRRIWDLWDTLSSEQRPNIELSDIVTSFVDCASRAPYSLELGALIIEALADRRVAADMHATAQLVAHHGHHIGMAPVAETGGDVTLSGLAILERSLMLFERAGPSVEHAATLRAFVRVKTLHRLETGTEEAELARAAVIARQVGAREVLIELEASHAAQEIRAGRVEQGVPLLRAAVDRIGKDPISEDMLWAFVDLSDVCIGLLYLPEALEVARTGIARALAGGLRESETVSILMANAVEPLLLSGDVAAAEDLLASDAATMTGRATPMTDLSRAEVHLIRGDLTRAARCVPPHGAMKIDELRIWWAEVHAEIDLWAGRPDVAGATVEHLCHAVPDLTVAGRALALAARAAADLADQRTTADREQLSQALRRTADRAQCFAPHPARTLGAGYGMTFAAEIARLEATDAELVWRASKDFWAQHRVVHRAGYAGWRLAEFLLQHGRRADAEAELVVAHTQAKTHVPMTREIEGLARRARLTLSSPTPVPDRGTATSKATTISHGLTARELEVLTLLSTGATNAEIGRHLYMSPKTASVHVSAIIRKLGAKGRVHAATIAERAGLLPAEEPRRPDR